MTSSRDAVVGALTTGVNHAVANRLATVRVLAELLGRRVDLPDDVRARLHDLSVAADTAGDLTQQLGAFAGRRPGPAVDLDIAACAAELAPLLDAALGRGNLELDIGAAPAVSRSDRASVEELVARLVLDVAEKQQTVRVRVDATPEVVEVAVGEVHPSTELDPVRLEALAAAAGGRLVVAGGSATVVLPRA